MPLYLKLQERIARCPRFALQAASTEPAESLVAYLANHGLSPTSTRSVPRTALKNTGYPTILVLNNFGTVVAAWRGSVPPAAEEEVLAQASCAPEVTTR